MLTNALLSCMSHKHYVQSSNHARQVVKTLLGLQIGNLQAMAQFLSNASKSLSGTLADILSPARMIIFGTLLTTINKPMFALSGYVFASFGTVVCLYWVTFAKVFDRMSKGVREAPGKALIGELAAESGDKTEGAFGTFFIPFPSGTEWCHHGS